MRDLRDRLRALGWLEVSGDSFDEATRAAVQSFQTSRGLQSTGLCERETWDALIEASIRLGDRLIYHRRPMLRGDDVRELQTRLNALGFDAGREDGIFGPQSERALREFQLNAGIVDDGVFGPESRSTLVRFGSLAAGSVAQVREREMLRTLRRSISTCRIFVGVEPGLDVLGSMVARGLSRAGAHAIADRSGADDHELARRANGFNADAFLALRPALTDGPRCCYFANQTFRSEAGFRLATSVDTALVEVIGPGKQPAGRTVILLRETRMAAVVCEPVRRADVDGMRDLVARSGQIADAVVKGVRRGVEVDGSPESLVDPADAS